jgi:hypothetical protein
LDHEASQPRDHTPEDHGRWRQHHDGRPFESVLRKGVQVSTTSVLRKQGDKLVGITVAHYKTKGADSVTRLPTTLTRVP